MVPAVEATHLCGSYREISANKTSRDKRQLYQPGHEHGQRRQQKALARRRIIGSGFSDLRQSLRSESVVGRVRFNLRNSLRRYTAKGNLPTRNLINYRPNC